jgi:hypothetical protein
MSRQASGHGLTRSRDTLPSYGSRDKSQATGLGTSHKLRVSGQVPSYDRMAFIVLSLFTHAASASYDRGVLNSPIVISWLQTRGKLT